MKYECEVCPYESSRLSKVEVHEEKCHPSCDTCERMFLDHPALRKHYLKSRHHNYCGICERDFKSPDARRKHYLTSRRHAYCGICEQEFSSAAALQGHQQTHLPRDVECPRCNKSFTSASAMVKHVWPHLVLWFDCSLYVWQYFFILCELTLFTVSHSGGAGEVFRALTWADC